MGSNSAGSSSVPATLRYHPELRHKVTDKTWIVLPAIVGQVVRFDLDPDETIAVHRTLRPFVRGQITA